MRTYLLAALLALAFNSHAQKNQAPVKGTVNDNNGTPLSGAAITSRMVPPTGYGAAALYKTAYI